MKVEKNDNTSENLEVTQDGVKETPIEEREYPFTEEQIQKLDIMMDDMRANYMTIEELGRRNREHSKNMHDFIREIHPALKEVDYMYNPISKKIQFRQKQ